MRRHWKRDLLAISFLLGAAPYLFGQGHTFTSIDFPGATSTQAWGITLSGDIVGFYVSADKATHGFLLSRGQYSSFPGAAFSELSGISPRGDLIGDYAATLTGSGPHHGFVLSRDGVFTTIDYPAATSTFAWGMNSHGDILGTYTLADNINHIFVMSPSQFSSPGQFTTLDDVKDSLTTGVLGISGGDIVGLYQSADKVFHGFVLSDGQITTIDAPGGAATYTNAVGIDSRGEVVGRFIVNGVTHAYLMSGGEFNSFDYPGATFTGGTAINLRGDIVGRYRDANNVFHGFMLVGFR